MSLKDWYENRWPVEHEVHQIATELPAPSDTVATIFTSRTAGSLRLITIPFCQRDRAAI